MNEQQLQQILTIQQAIAAAATAAVINSLLNPQQAASNGLQNTNINALTEALQNSQNQLDLQQQPDSRQDSPIATSGSPAASLIPNDASRIQELLVQLQQQAANSGLNAANNTTLPQHHQQQQQQQQQAALLAALNLNLNNANNLPLQQQLQANLTSNPLSQASIAGRLQLEQAELNLAAATGSNISNQASPNKKLKNRHIQPPVVPSYTPQSRSSLETTNKPQQSTPKSQHSNLGNLSNRNNTSGNSGSSSSFLPNNVGLPRKLVRGQDVWLGRGAEQTRQILKCMWCGQSFRTLAEMTQHMRETQHYTNIISQEQITSWRQPDGSESSSIKHNKQSNHNSRITEDLLDDTSEKFNDSEDNFSNDDEASPRQRTKGKSMTKSSSSKKDILHTEIASSESALSDQYSTTNSLSKFSSKNSRKRENSDLTKPTTKREKLDSLASPSSTSSSQQRVLNDLNGNSETSKDVKSDLDERESSVSNRAASNHEDRELTESPSIKSENNRTEDSISEEQKTKIRSDSRSSDREDDIENNTEEGESNDPRDELEDRNRDECEEDSKSFDQLDDDEKNSDNKKIKHRSNKKHSEIDIATSTKQSIVDGQKLDASGDPLSALETMVEKSFDPRMRPGIASGGILQRLGIDEEVCPPWQHINYANWYAAAAYGHPMAAALLAAGINLQNGIKLGKNVSSKKSEDD